MALQEKLGNLNCLKIQHGGFSLSKVEVFVKIPEAPARQKVD